MKTRVLTILMVAAGCSSGGDSSPISGVQSLCDAVSTDDLVIDGKDDLDAAIAVELVNGDVLVCSTVDIVSLSLPVLAEVKGNVIIYANPNIESVSLPLLEVVGDAPNPRRTWSGFLIEGNSALTDVDAPVLRDVSQHVWLADNALLTAIDLPALSRVQGAFALRATHVEALDGFAELRFVGGAVAIYDNTELTEVTGLTNLVTVSSELLFTNNAKLTTVTLPELHTVGGFTEIADNGVLNQLDLPALTTVGRSLTVVGTALTNAGGLAALDTVAGDLAFTYNDDLTDITLPALQQIGGDLLLANNEALIGVTMDLLAFIGDSLTVSDNTTLTSLSFAALAYVAGNLIVRDNPAFPTCAAEDLRDDIGTDNIGGEVAIVGNNDVTLCP